MMHESGEYMIKRLSTLIIILTIIISNLAISASSTTSKLITKNENFLYVGGSGPENYTKIQNAVENASSDDTIFVFNGTYYENVLINKSIQLVGENEENTIIDGKDGLFSISIKSQNVLIKHIKITNSSHDGIKISKNSDRTKILNCIIEKCQWMGVFIENTENIIIDDCKFIDNLNGIGQIDSNYSTINNCDFRNDQWNIIFWNSLFNKILNCNINSNTESDGIYLHGSRNNDIYNCTISKIRDAISLYGYSSYNTIDKCKIIDIKNRGILISEGIINKVSNTTIINCESGIELYGDSFIGHDSELNEIDNCLISKNSKYGILIMPDCHYNKVINCEISNNKYGLITQLDTYKNRMYNNEFIDNIEYQAYDAGKNIWNNSYPFGGNFWIDYNGIDQNSGPGQNIVGCDGIGDIPYEIPGGKNVDHYPLVPIDSEEPIVKIEKPTSKLYLFNKCIRKFYSNRLPLIIGGITVEVYANDNHSGIRYIEFYIDEELKANVTSKPYSWNWTGWEILKHQHTIKIIAYDYAGNNASDKIKVWNFL